MKVENILIDNVSKIWCEGKIHDFEPYFFVPESEPIPHSEHIKRVDKGDWVAIDGTKLKKIIVYISRTVPQVRALFKRHFEADVVFTKRFMIDNEIIQKNDKIVFVDIETAVEASNVTDYKQPITVMGVFFDNKYYTFTWRKDLLEKKVKMKWKDRITGKEHKWDVYQFNDERRMLMTFLNWINWCKMDMVVEWCRPGDFYDAPFIIKRLEFLKLDYHKLSQMGRVYCFPGRLEIGGVEICNLADFYMRYKMKEVERYNLDDVSKKELGIGKYKLIQDHKKEWKENLKEYLKYNLCDVELMVNLDRKLKIFDYVKTVINRIGCEINDFWFNSRMVYMYLLKNAKMKGFKLESQKYKHVYTVDGSIDKLKQLLKFKLIDERKNRFIIETEKELKDKQIGDLNRMITPTKLYSFKGAIVLIPKSKELHEDIECYDWKGLYPNIMISNNMSPETLDKNGDIKIGNGVCFSSKKKGFIPEVLENLFSLRTDIKKEMNKYPEDSEQYNNLWLKQFAVKSLINSFYGVMKKLSFNIAESVTYIGRKMINWTVKKVEELDCEVLYGDTDSVFILNKTELKGENFAKKLTEDFQKEFKLNCEIEFEAHYPKGIFFTRKRYVLLKENGELKIRGIELRRSDCSEYTKYMLRKIIDKLFEGAGKNEIYEYIRSIIEKVTKYKPEFLAIPRKLSFTEHTRRNIFHKGAIWSNNNLNKNYKPGDKPFYLPAKNEAGGICFDNDIDVKNIKLDYNIIIEKDVYRKLENIFETFGFKISELKTGYSQTTFGDFK